VSKRVGEYLVLKRDALMCIYADLAWTILLRCVIFFSSSFFLYSQARKKHALR
jgi:hypothetical protein